MFLPYTNKEIEYLKSKDEKLANAIEYFGVLERDIEPDFERALCKQIISQQISKGAAESVCKRVEEMTDFSMEKILSISEDELQSCGLSFRKVTYLKESATFIVENKITTDKLATWSDEKIEKTLTKIKGVGPWTVEMLLIFTFQRSDIISFKDIAIQRGIKRLYGIHEISKEMEIEIKERLSPYGSIASLYFWEISHLKEDELDKIR